MDRMIEKRAFSIALKVGTLTYALFFLLDLVVYPDYMFTFLIIRVAVCLFLTLANFALSRINEKFLFALVASSFTIAAFGLSSMCYLSGEGFESPYYVGNILALIVVSFFLRIELRQFILVVSGILVQHFVLLAFVPFEFKYLFMNAYFLGAAAIMAVIANHFINELVKEVTTLKGLLPICASCKKIRDDGGYWQQMEQYISEHSNAEFTHGLCPECVEETMKELANITQKSPV